MLIFRSIIVLKTQYVLMPTKASVIVSFKIPEPQKMTDGINKQQYARILDDFGCDI